MSKPVVAIVGRPNVGKSTFFNRVCGKRISIVEDMPGVTRDRIYGEAEWVGYSFTLIDTGGLDTKNQTEIQKNILNQAQVAVDLADVIILMVDGREGLTAGDHDAANFLRKCKKPIVLMVNKLDNRDQNSMFEFYQLGMGEPLPISCEQGKGIGDALDEVVKCFKNKVEKEEEKSALKIAIVGKPNAGKSSLTNKLLGEERVVVSSIAGTTRDSIDTPFKYDGKDYVVIDTAGMRRKRAIDSDSIERYSVIRAIESVKRADIVLVMIDAEEGITEQDAKIAGFINDENKPSIIVVNKWDLIEKDGKTTIEFTNKIKSDLAFMNYVRIMFVSCLTGQRISKIMPEILSVYENNSKRISTGILNELIQDAVSAKETPTTKSKKLKIYYATQSQANPPVFLLFVNDATLMTNNYLRYLENYIRKSVDFSGTPIKLICKSRSEKDD